MLADDPALTVRLPQRRGRASRYRVVVDSRARLPLDARLLERRNAGRARSWWRSADAPPRGVAALESRGVTVLACKSRDGRVDVVDLGARLFALDVIAVLLEGGRRAHRRRSCRRAWWIASPPSWPPR